MAVSILVAEDDPGLASLYRIWLEAEGYRVLLARDGGEALDLIHVAGLPDAAVLDVEMPRVDGFEVCRRLRRLSPRMPIVIATGKAGLEEAATVAGADLVLMKTGVRGPLLDALRSLLGRASAAAA